jgi:hypothetical protein
MLCDQDIAIGTFAKDDFHKQHFKFETQELNNMKALNHQRENQQWMSNIESKAIKLQHDCEEQLMLKKKVLLVEVDARNQPI